MDNLIAVLSTIMLLFMLAILLLRSIKKDYEKRHPEIFLDCHKEVHNDSGVSKKVD